MLSNFLTVRLSDDERAMIDRLSKETRRPYSNLVRTALLLAATDPQLRQRLGADPSTTQPPAAEKRA